MATAVKRFSTDTQNKIKDLTVHSCFCVSINFPIKKDELSARKEEDKIKKLIKIFSHFAGIFKGSVALEKPDVILKHFACSDPGCLKITVTTVN